MPGLQFFLGLEPVFLRRPFRTASGAPNIVGKRRDGLLVSLLNARIGTMFHGNLLVVLLREPKGLVGALKTLSGLLMPGQVNFLSVPLGAGAMRMGRSVAALGGYLL